MYHKTILYDTETQSTGTATINGNATANTRKYFHMSLQQASIPFSPTSHSYCIISINFFPYTVPTYIQLNRQNHVQQTFNVP